MTEPSLGYPFLIWQVLLSLWVFGSRVFLIAFVTIFYLKRKDESTRVAGVTAGKAGGCRVLQLMVEFKN